MKLLCVIPSYWPAFQFGGPIFSVHDLNKALVKKGIDVTVYTTNVGLKGNLHVNQEVDVDGVKVTYFAYTKLFEFMGTTGWQFSWQMTRALKKNLKSFDIVHIHAVWNYPTAVAGHYCRLYKKPYIIATRGTLYPYTLSKKFWKKWFYYHFIAKRDLEGATAIHYTTEDEAEGCHPFLGLKNQAIIIPNGVDLSEFKDYGLGDYGVRGRELSLRESLRNRYPILKDKKIILFLGRIHWKKGLDLLIKAYAKLVKERDDVHLLIAGNDEDGYSKKVKTWLKEFSIPFISTKARVTFTGMLTGKEKLEAYSGSDIFVLPSYSENFGMSVIEAMACGVPVVISNKVGIYKEIQGNKAGIVVDTNAESLYKGIKLLLDNSELRKEIANNGEKLVEEYYDIDKVAERMIKAYVEMLERCKR